MHLLYEIIKELLQEDVSVEEVNDAINNTYEVEINYHSNGDNIATGRRIIQPVAYGLTKSGNPVIRAFQPYGDTTTSIPAWKFFRLDRISNWKPLKLKIFSEPPGTYSADGIFNPNGDKTMSTVYTIAKFNKNSPVNNKIEINNTGPVKKSDIKQEPEVFKTDTERGIENLRKQLENPQYISPKQPKVSSSGPVKKSDIKQEPEVFKTDTERGIENLRKQLENPQYISDIVKNKYFNKKPTINNTGPVKKSDIKQEPEVFKTDTERGIENLRKQLENPQYISK